MPPYIDVHCHLDFPDLFERISQVIQNAKKSEIGIIITNGIDRKSNRISLNLADKYPEVNAALGIYPIDKKDKYNDKDFHDELNFIKINNDKIIALGEIGLDYKNCDDKELQKKVFIAQLNLATQLNKPVIIHSRNAEADVIDILQQQSMDKVILHCFGGKKRLVEKALNLGYSFSITTNVVRSEHMQQIARIVPLNQLFAETDSPFLSPFKDKTNEPSFVLASYKKIAEIKALTLEEVRNNIFMNYQNLFL